MKHYRREKVEGVCVHYGPEKVSNRLPHKQLFRWTVRTEKESSEIDQRPLEPEMKKVLNISMLGSREAKRWVQQGLVLTPIMFQLKC